MPGVGGVPRRRAALLGVGRAVGCPTVDPCRMLLPSALAFLRTRGLAERAAADSAADAARKEA